MSVSCECCVLSGRGPCDGPIPRIEESYRLLYVFVCDLETLSTRRPWPALDCCATKTASYLNNCVTRTNALDVYKNLQLDTALCLKHIRYTSDLAMQPSSGTKPYKTRSVWSLSNSDNG